MKTGRISYKTEDQMEYLFNLYKKVKIIKWTIIITSTVNTYWQCFNLLSDANIWSSSNLIIDQVVWVPRLLKDVELIYFSNLILT